MSLQIPPGQGTAGLEIFYLDPGIFTPANTRASAGAYFGEAQAALDGIANTVTAPLAQQTGNQSDLDAGHAELLAGIEDQTTQADQDTANTAPLLDDQISPAMPGVTQNLADAGVGVTRAPGGWPGGVDIGTAPDPDPGPEPGGGGGGGGQPV